MKTRCKLQGLTYGIAAGHGHNRFVDKNDFQATFVFDQTRKHIPTDKVVIVD